MADVFISYARDDRVRIERLAKALHSAGLSVWWDRDIETGEAFSKIIVRELNSAKAVVVAWSTASNESEWVKDEASYARKHQKYCPIRLDRSEPPLGFQQFQSIDFSAWRGDAFDDEFQKLLQSIKRKIAAEPSSAAQSAPPVKIRSRLSAMLQFGRKRRLLIAACVAFLAAVAFASTYVFSGNTARPAPEASVAVIPLVSMSSDREDEYFADGLSEEIMNDLARIRELLVAGRSSSFHYKGRNDNLREVATELGVAHILEGSVRRSDERLRITVQLVNAETGFQLWSETYDRDLDDIFAIQEDIAKRVASALRVSILGDEFAQIAADNSNDAVAEKSFLIALGKYRIRNYGDLIEAESIVKTALELSPNHIKAIALYVLITRELAMIGRTPWRDYLAAAEQQLQPMVTLNPTSAELQVAYAMVLADKATFNRGVMGLGDFPTILTSNGADPVLLAQAETHASIAKDIEPRSIEAIEALSYIALLRRNRTPDEIDALLREGLALDPDTRTLKMYRVWNQFINGNLSEAVSQIDNFIERDPDYAPALLMGGMLYGYLGRYEDQAKLIVRASGASSAPLYMQYEANAWFSLRLENHAISVLYAGLDKSNLSELERSIFQTTVMMLSRNYDMAYKWSKEQFEISGMNLTMGFLLPLADQTGHQTEASEILKGVAPSLYKVGPVKIDWTNLPWVPYAAEFARASGDENRSRDLCTSAIKFLDEDGPQHRITDWQFYFLCLAVIGDTDGAADIYAWAVEHGHQQNFLYGRTVMFSNVDDLKMLGDVLEHPVFIAAVETQKKRANNAVAALRREGWLEAEGVE